MVQQALREVRLLIYELRPTELEEEGLLGALYRRLETVERRAGLQSRLTVTDEKGRPCPMLSNGRAATVDFYRLPPFMELELYRISQEALNNVLKHSGATAVHVHIRMDKDTLGIDSFIPNVDQANIVRFRAVATSNETAPVSAESEFAQLSQQIIENTMLNGETIRLDGAIRLAPK